MPIALDYGRLEDYMQHKIKYFHPFKMQVRDRLQAQLFAVSFTESCLPKLDN